MTTMPVPRGFVVTSGFGPRWGTTHWGTDFGKAGGSGGQPIYAVRDGLVTRAGAASGFGQWITLDVDAQHGGGLYVYGHIIPEVTVGQRVIEGQRIGHINPDSSTNGGVAPHLHFEHHRYVWSQPGPDRLDPMQNVLAGAKWVGDSTKEGSMTTIFGVDVSEHQDGMSLAAAKAQGMDFAILRLCDGTYRDRTFRSHLADAENAGLLVSTYWYLRAPSEGSTIAQQVDVIDRQMGGRRDLGVWIDVESVAGGRKLLTGADVWAAKRELEKRGYHVPGIYSGAWYWEQMPGGEPSMDGLGYLWVSSYGRNRTGAPRDLYDGDGGDAHPGWNYPLGNRKPDILQYGSNATVAGHTVDINAYKGTRDQLATIFNDTQPQEEITVSEADRIIRHITDYISGFVGPIGSDTKDVRQQLTGGRDAGDYRGWPQLGKDEQGRDLTVTDAIAAIRHQLVQIQTDINQLKERK
ncbi:GH25 family lysozyme [Corynebacterium phoceense]|uniref:GH25 family lysozyme n=1 Tax=Corynebacterium phoceense TaxID=1686286 RepID=UPI0034CFFF5D